MEPALNRTTPVGSYPPNAFGLYDMHGNVWNWCNDYFDYHTYDERERVDPRGKPEGHRHVLRGGG